MSNMISFEIKKFFHRKKNIFIIMIFIALSIGFIMINSSLENQYKKSEISSIDYSIESLKKDIPDTKDTLKQYPGNKNLEVLLETQEKEIKIYEKQKEAYINKDYILNGNYASSATANETDNSITDNSNTEANGTNNSVENYTRRKVGNDGISATTQALLKQYRDTLVAVDEDIINELNVLFMGLW